MTTYIGLYAHLPLLSLKYHRFLLVLSNGHEYYRVP